MPWLEAKYSPTVPYIMRDTIFSGPEDPGSRDLGPEDLGPGTQLQGPRDPNWHALCVYVEPRRKTHSVRGSVSLIAQMEYRLVQ